MLRSFRLGACKVKKKADFRILRECIPRPHHRTRFAFPDAAAPRSLEAPSFVHLRQYASDPNSQLSHSQQRSGHDTVGLFGVVGLHCPKDFETLADRSIAHIVELCQVGAPPIGSSLLAAIGALTFFRPQKAASGSLSPTVLLDVLDDMSDSICLVMDAAELCRPAPRTFPAHTTRPNRPFTCARPPPSSCRNRAHMHAHRRRCVHPDGAMAAAADATHARMGELTQELNAHAGLHAALAAAMDAAAAAGLYDEEQARPPPRA